MSGEEKTVMDFVPTAQSDAASIDFDEAMMRHFRAVFRTARALVRDSALAEDVTQEVFLRLYRNLDSTPGEERLRAWLLRVTMNVARNTMRSQARASEQEDEYAKSAEATGWFTVAAPEDDYERRMEIEEARRALDKIKEPMRSALLLKQQGLSYREIATALQINETNVGSLIARGRKEFIRVYGKVLGTPTTTDDSDRSETIVMPPPTVAESREADTEAVKIAITNGVREIEERLKRMEQDQLDISHLRKQTRSIMAQLQMS